MARSSRCTARCITCHNTIHTKNSGAQASRSHSQSRAVVTLSTLPVLTKSDTRLSLPLSLSDILQALTAHLSLSLCTPSTCKSPHPPLAPSPSFSNILQALTAHFSLSLCTTSTLKWPHPLLSLPLALSNIFRALTAHLSLSLAVYIYIYIYTSSNDNAPHLPLAPSRSL